MRRLIAPLLAVSALSVVIALAGCSSAAPVWEPSGLKSALKSIQKAATEATSIAELRGTSLADDLVKAIDDAPSPGSLSGAARDAIVDATLARVALGRLDDAAAAASVEADVMTVKARRAANDALTGAPSEALATDLTEFGVEIIRETSCSNAGELLTPSEADRVAASELTYRADGLTSIDQWLAYGMEQFAARGYELDEVESVITMHSFIGNAIAYGEQYSNSFDGRITAPDWETTEAFVYYLGVCVAA